MNTKNISIKKNYLYNTFYQLLTVIVPLITAPYISRVLGADKIGIQSYTNSIVTYFTLFAALGTASYGQREIAMHRDDPEESSRLFWEIELLSVCTTLVVTAAWVVWILVTSTYTAYYIVLTMTLVAVAFDISWYFGGFEMFKYIVIRNAAVKIIGVILLLTFVHSPDDALLYVGMVAATGLLGNISMWSYLPRMLHKVDRHDLRIFRHFKQTMAYFIPTIATSVYTVLDKTMIGLITGSETENGYYEQASKIIKITESCLFSLNKVMTARMSYLFAEGRTDEIKDKILRSYDFIFLLAVPFMFGLMGIAQHFVGWFFGSGYDPVIDLLWIMSPLPLIISISNVLGSQYLTPSGQRVRSSKGIIAGACVNFCCNSLMIPRFGAMGAVAASLIAEFVISAIYVHMSKGYISWGQLWQRLYKRLTAGLIMLAAVLGIGQVMGDSIVTTLVQGIAGAAIYGAVLWLLRDAFLIDNAKHYLQLILSKLRRR